MRIEAYMTISVKYYTISDIFHVTTRLSHQTSTNNNNLVKKSAAAEQLLL